MEIKDVLAVQTQAGYALYPMFKEVAVCCWSYLFWFFLFFLKGKIFSMSDNPSLDSVDSEYDMGSVQRDLNFLEDNPSLKDIMLANQPSPRMTSPFISLRPANPAMQALSSQKREAHNRSPVSFREGRRASDTSLTQGDRTLCLVARKTLLLQDSRGFVAMLVSHLWSPKGLMFYLFKLFGHCSLFQELWHLDNIFRIWPEPKES